MWAPSWDRLRGKGCERLGVKKRRLKHSARLWTWSDFMCPAASQRQPCETCSMARIFGWAKKISGYYNYCHLSFCPLFFRLTPYRAFAKKKKKKIPPSPFKRLQESHILELCQVHSSFQLIRAKLVTWEKIIQISQWYINYIRQIYRCIDR